VQRPATGNAKVDRGYVPIADPKCAPAQQQLKSASAGVTMAHVVVRMSCRIASSIIGLRPFIAVTGADPKQAFDSADSAADHPPDGPSDRARRVLSDGGAMGGACGNALRLRCERRRKSCDQGGRQYAVKPHATNPSLHCGKSPRGGQ
jgi:hypothetical protein